jgi:hypothetical protein
MIAAADLLIWVIRGPLTAPKFAKPVRIGLTVTTNLTVFIIGAVAATRIFKWVNNI